VEKKTRFVPAKSNPSGKRVQGDCSWLRQPRRLVCSPLWKLPCLRVLPVAIRAWRIFQRGLVTCWCERCSFSGRSDWIAPGICAATRGDGLGVLTGRPRAYGYFHTERFLAQIAQANGADTFTDGLAQWTARLWNPPTAPTQEVEPLYYIDGHRKPVYADALIPRGLIGNSGKILGCRALVLLHDEQGHPRLATTHRGDQHLTVGVPAILTRYEQATGKAAQARIIVDREGMAAQFLADLVAAGRTVVTVLRTDQYANLESFTEVGAFVPLEHDRQGKLIREVAAACFALPLPDQPGASLPLQVAHVA